MNQNKNFLKKITFPVGPLQCNCSVIYDEKTCEAIVVDPGDEAQKIKEKIQSLGLKLKMAIHTHAHFDHVGATLELKQNYQNMQVCLHKEDEWLYNELPMQGRLFGFHFLPPPKIEFYLKDDQSLSIAGNEFLVIHTPGHSPGGVCLYFKEKTLSDTPVLFTGDTLFKRSIGRADLWGGDYEKLLKSIKERLLVFDDSTYVIPGHGDSTTIGEEEILNPFLR
jgi:glyoxylase-like metal-dependent hydrolase (beta-lactamase superfamily II)